MQAEVMAIRPGLKATWLNNIRQVIVESDSVWALRLVSQAIASSHHPLGSIVNIY
jgi:ribonuclease HI